MQIARLGAGSALRGLVGSSGAGVRRGLEKIYGVYFIVVFLLWIVPASARVRLIKDEKAAGRFTSAALNILFALAGIRLKVMGKEYMDTPGAKVYAANHASYFDVLPVMMGLGVRYRFVAKSEVRGMPFIGTFLNQMGHLSFDRTDANARLRQADQMERFCAEAIRCLCFRRERLRRKTGCGRFNLARFRPR